MKPSVYLETSVVSYYTSSPSRDIFVLTHQQITKEWWDTKSDIFDFLVSELVIDEVSRGDSEAATTRLAIIEDFSILPLTDEIRKLARVLVTALNIPEDALPDALHLAASSIHKVDYLVTWNCKHLANGVIIKKLNDLKEKTGIHVPVICTPEELMEV